MNRTAHEPSLIKNNILKAYFPANNNAIVKWFLLLNLFKFTDCLLLEALFGSFAEVDLEALKASIYLLNTTMPKANVRSGPFI